MGARATRLWILAIAVLAVAAWVWSADREDAHPEAATYPGEPAAAVVEVIRDEAARDPIHETPQPVEPATPRQPEPTRFGTVELRALDERGAAISDFTWARALATPGMSAGGTAVGQVAHLRVPLDLPAAVYLEAEGFVRSLAVDVALRGGATHRSASARLVPKATEPAILLRVVDDRGVPVTRVRVTCGTPVEDSRNAWRVRWTTDSDAPDGLHRLASGETGRHRMRVVALEPRGLPRMLLPVTRTVTHDGIGTTDEDVAVTEPGGSIVLTVRERDGSFAGPSLSVRLIDRAGRIRTPRWIARGTLAVAAGSLPTAGPCELFEPIPPGEYAVEIERNDTAQRQAVVVAPNARVHSEFRLR